MRGYTLKAVSYIEHCTVNAVSSLADLEQSTVKSVSCDVDLVKQCIKAASYGMLLPSDSLADLEQCENIFNHFLEGVGQHLWGCFQVLNKNPNPNPYRVGVAPVGLSCNFTRTDGEMDLAMEDKGTPHVVIGSCSPTRARIAA